VQYWLLKTEPDVYSYNDLRKDGKTSWNGVRNFQARNYIRSMNVGDFCFIYHTGRESRVVGLAKVASKAYPEIDPHREGDWFQCDIVPVQQCANFYALVDMKQDLPLQKCVLLKQSRLSVVPLQQEEFLWIQYKTGL
jgi:predicted RNA-binding protein with PUA-like domain